MKNYFLLSKLMAFMLFFGALGASNSGYAQCTIEVSVSSPSWGDGTTWTLTDLFGTTVLSGGSYANGYADVQTLTNADAGPYEFFINSTFGDNSPDYSISINGTEVASGNLPGESNLTIPGIGPDCVATECEGTPNPGNTLSSVPSVCPSVNFTLSLENSATLGSGNNFVWESSTDGVVWEPIAGAASSPLHTTSITANTFFRCEVTCIASGETGVSDPIEVEVNSFLNCYCTTTAPTSAFDSQILAVTLNGDGNSINIETPCPAPTGPQDFTSTSVNLMQGLIYDLSVLMGQCGDFAYNNTIKAWIDYNQDGVWDEDEVLGFYSGEAPPAGELNTISFTVPIDAITGLTGMRLIMQETLNPDFVTPCGVFGFGSVYDFTVNILQTDACAGVPDPGNTLSSQPSVCPSANFTLTLQNATIGTGVTYQWQTSEDGVDWVDAFGAPNAASWTTNHMQATHYRCIVSCETSDESTASEGVLVGLNNFMDCYCTNVGPTSATFSELFNVNINSGQDEINNDTPCPAVTGLQDFTSQVVTLAQGEEYDLNFIIGQCGSTGTYTNTLKAWIDYNQNGTFDVMEEELGVFTAPAPPDGVAGNLTFTVPADATLGQTMMRVVTNETSIVGNVQPCGTFTWGSAHDYMVTIVAPPTCPMPTEVVVSNIIESGADATWTPGGDEENWEVHYGEAGFTPGDGTTDDTDEPSYTFTGLDENTAYEFYVRAICGDGDTSFWRGPIAFTTTCNVVMAPYIENFDGPEWVSGTGFNNAGAIISDCWDNDPSASPAFFWGTRTGITSNSTTTGPPSDKSGNGNYIFTEASNGATFAGLVATFDSPRIDLSEIADPYLGFSYFMRGADVDSLNVYVSNDNGDTWNDLAVIVGQQQFQLTDPWKDTIVSLAAYENETIIVRFQNIKNASFNDDVAIDDFFILPCVGNPGTSGEQDVCVLDGEIELASIVEIAQVGGTWSFPSNPVYVVDNTTFNYSILPAGSYNVTYTVPGACEDGSMAATINVFPPSSAGQSASFSNCNNGVINLFDGITGLVDLTGTWYTPGNQPLNSALVNVNGQLPGVYNYYYIASNNVCPADTSFAEVTLIDCASIEEHALSGFEMYPNPTDEVVFISYNGDAINAEVYVSDMKGSVIYMENRSFEANSTLEIDLSKAQAGAYIVTITSEGKRTTMNLIKK